MSSVINFIFSFFDEVVKLVDGGSVINGATPSSLIIEELMAALEAGFFLVCGKNEVLTDSFFLRRPNIMG